MRAPRCDERARGTLSSLLNSSRCPQTSWCGGVCSVRQPRERGQQTPEKRALRPGERREAMVRERVEGEPAGSPLPSLFPGLRGSARDRGRDERAGEAGEAGEARVPEPKTKRRSTLTPSPPLVSLSLSSSLFSLKSYLSQRKELRTWSILLPISQCLMMGWERGKRDERRKRRRSSLHGARAGTDGDGGGWMGMGQRRVLLLPPQLPHHSVERSILISSYLPFSRPELIVDYTVEE